MNLTIKEVKEKLLLILVAVLPANGIIIPLGRNWTLLQLVIVVFALIYLIELIFSKNFTIKLTKKYFILCFLFFSVALFSFFNRPSISKLRYTRKLNFPIKDYDKIGLMYCLWLVLSIFFVIVIYKECYSRGVFDKIIKVLLQSSLFYAIYGFYQFIIVYVLGVSSQGLVYSFRDEYLWGPDAIRTASLEREPLYYSFYLVAIILLTISLLKYKKYDILPKKRLKMILIFNILVFLLAKPSMGFLGLVIGIVFMNKNYFRLKRRINLQGVLYRFFAVFGSLLFILFYLILNGNKISSRLRRIVDPTSGYDRVVSYIQGVNLLESYWQTGIGYGNSPYFIGPQVIHNMYLSIFVEVGVLGLLLVISVLWLLWKKISQISVSDKVYREVLQGYLIATCIQWLTFYNFNLPSFWFFSAMILVISSENMKKKIK